MADAARRRMTVEAFLAWDDGTDRPCQVIGGEVVAMTPAREGHAALVGKLAAKIDPWLRPPCRVVVGAGIRLPDRDDAFYVADLAVTCAPPQPNLLWMSAPLVIFEVLSPTTPAEDCDIKFPDYQRLPWAQEIVLVSSDRRLNRVWRRAGARWELEVVEGDGVLAIESLGIVLSLAAFYDGTGIT